MFGNKSQVHSNFGIYIVSMAVLLLLDQFFAVEGLCFFLNLFIVVFFLCKKGMAGRPTYPLKCLRPLHFNITTISESFNKDNTTLGLPRCT